MRASRFVPVAVGLALLAAVATPLLHGGTGAAALANCEIGDNDIALDTEEQAFLAAVNAERAALGRAPVAPSNTLNRAAAWKSADQLRVGGLSHTDSLGRPYDARVHDCGYPRGGYLGEVTLVGTTGGQRAFDLFKTSPGHYATIVHPDFRFIGIGRAGPYWTAAFGSVADGPGGVTAGPTSPASTASPGTTAIPATATATRTSTPTATPTATATPTPSPTPLPTAPPAGIAVTLQAGANLVTYAGPRQPAAAALRSLEGKVLDAYRWDPLGQRWLRWAPNVPGYATQFTHFEPGESYFIRLTGDAVWSY